MAAGDLCSVADVKAWIGKTDSNADALLADLVTNASEFIVTYCSRSFAGGAVAVGPEIRDGSGGTEMFLRVQPVATITTLTIDGQAIPAQPADQQPGYFVVNNELLCLFGYSFTKARKNVRVSYTAGFATVPASIKQVCKEIAADMYARGSRKDPSLNSKGSQSSQIHEAWSLKDVPPSVLGTLNRYRNVVPA